MAAADPGDDLFSAAASDVLAHSAPLAARLRPRTIDDIVGQEELLGPGGRCGRWWSRTGCRR